MRKDPISAEIQNAQKALENIRADIQSETKIIEDLYRKKKDVQDEVSMAEAQKESITKFIESENIKLTARLDEIAAREKQHTDKLGVFAKEIKDIREKIKSETRSLNWVIDKVLKEEEILKSLEEKAKGFIQLDSDIRAAVQLKFALEKDLQGLSDRKDSTIKEHSKLMDSLIADLIRAQKNKEGVEEETILALQRRDRAVAEYNEALAQHRMAQVDFDIMEKRVEEKYQLSFPGMNPRKAKK